MTEKTDVDFFKTCKNTENHIGFGLRIIDRLSDLDAQTLPTKDRVFLCRLKSMFLRKGPTEKKSFESFSQIPQISLTTIIH